MVYVSTTSQYNRLKLKASDYHGISNDINWEKLGGHTSGYGQMHLSSETLEVLKKIGWDKKARELDKIRIEELKKQQLETAATSE